MSSNTKKIGLIACTGLVAGNMMGSGIALLPTTLASVGSVALFSWLICLVGALALAFVFARQAINNPQAGGPIAYSGEMAPILGFQSSVLYYHANWIGNLATAITGVSYLSVFFPTLNQPIPAAIATIVAVWLFTFINLLGGSWVSRLTTLGLGLLMIPILGTAIFGWSHFESHMYIQNWNVSGKSDPQAAISVVLICLWAFVGVESASVSSGLVHNPKRTVPLATLLGTVIAGVIYILSSQVLNGMFTDHQLAESGAPFAMAMSHIFGTWTAPFVSGFTALSCFTCLGSWMMLVGETGKRAAKDGNFPKIYEKTSKTGVARNALILTSLKMTALMILLAIFQSKSEHASQLFSELTTDAVLLFMLPYFYSSLNLIRVEGATSRSVISSCVGGIACLFCIIALVGSNSSNVVAAFVVSLIILMFYARKIGHKGHQA